MFCIAAFIILAVISIFSARYRRMAKQAWGCVARRVTFRPCDTKFKDELKSRLLARVALKSPRWVKTADIALEVAAFLIILLTLWSVFVVVKSGLNLYVYGTCSPANAASCSLGAEACSIESVSPSFVTSLKKFKLHEWIGHEATSFKDTVAAIPTRMQDWKAETYLPQNPSYKQPYDAAKPTALEVIDPGCQYCKQLYANLSEARFFDRYNVAYIAYPIEDTTTKSGYKFANSLTVVRYLEAIKMHPLQGATAPADWRMLDLIFAGKDEKNVSYQVKINSLLNQTQAESLLKSWLRDFGYSEEQIEEIARTAQSEAVTSILDNNRRTVKDKIKTVKIPTIIYGGRRHDGVVKTADLQ